MYTILIQNITANHPNPNGEVEQASDKIRVGENVGHPVFATGPVVFDLNSEIYLQAANEITFEPGFETKQGALMVAYIAPCNDNPCVPDENFLTGGFNVTIINQDEYEFEFEVTAQSGINNVEINILNPEPGQQFNITLSKVNNDFDNNGKAIVTLPVYPTTSVCGNYYIEVKAHFCGGTEEIVTLNWDRNFLINSTFPELNQIINPNMTCTLGLSCLLSIEVSKTIEINVDLENTSGDVLIYGNTINSDESTNKQYVIFDLNQISPSEPSKTKVFLKGYLLGHCNNLYINSNSIEISYVD